MKKLALSAIITTSLLASASLYASSGVYFTGAVGAASQADMPSKSNVLDAATPVLGTTAVTETTQNAAGRLGVGYNYDLNSHVGIGVEAAYGLYGNTEYKMSGGTAANIKYTSSTIEGLIVPTWHATNHIDVFAKAGYAYHTLEIDNVASVVPGASESEQDFHPEVGFGFGYSISHQMSLNLSYYHIGGDKVSFDSPASASNEPPINAVLFGGNFTL